MSTIGDNDHGGVQLVQATTARPPRPATINVTVTFPLSTRGSFRDRRPENETVASLLEAAMRFFAATPDPEYIYYLTHEKRRLAESETIGEVVGHARAARFSLIKELIQG